MQRRQFIRRTAATLAVLSVAIIGFGLERSSPARADERYIVVGSTTSTQDSGLFGWLLPAFTQASGIEVRIVAKGTGEAIKLGQAGDADVLLVHDPKSEIQFVADGYGVKRYAFMYNDFILLGPKSDPAHVAGDTDVVDALKKIAAAGALFASRGDDSGTNKAELRLWKAAGIDPKPSSGKWYLETGSGMGATLNTAVGKAAYTLSDRATWLAFQNKGDFAILVEGGKALLNQYGVMLVNPARFPSVRAKDGQAFIDWLISPAGQKTIADFRVGGQQVFFPNYVAGQ
jgi:tungstate transport system substrate-binding protein